MPAATPEKRARQRANKLSQKHSALSAITPPSETAEIASHASPASSTSVSSTPAENTTPASWPAPAPITFSISYNPLSVSYPEPENPAAKLPTDAVRITRDELALMLRQSYIHGTDHGWKSNLVMAREHLQTDYEQDMLKATTEFAEHEKRIREEEYNRGSEDGRNHCQAQLVSAKARLHAMYEQRHLDALEGFTERLQELGDVEFRRGFDEGHEASVREETASPKSIQPPQVHVSTQTELPKFEQSLHADLGIQTELVPLSPAPSPSSLLPLPLLSDSLQPTSFSIPVSKFISSLFQPLELTTTIISNLLLSTHDSNPTSAFPSSFLWSDEPPDTPISPLLPSIPISPPIIPTSFPRRDFSDLRSGANPWRSLQHRKGRDRRRSTQPLRQREHQQPSYTSKTFPSVPRTPTARYSKPPPSPLAPLNWDADPRLRDLSRVLGALGWAPPLIPRLSDRFS